MSEGGCLLIIEDNPGDVRLLEEALEIPKECIAVAQDGLAALQYMFRRPPYTAAQTPSMVILDLNLPRISGQAVLATLRSSRRFKAIPIIVFTSSRADLDRRRAMETGATNFLYKASTLEEFFIQAKYFRNFWLQVSGISGEADLNCASFKDASRQPALRGLPIDAFTQWPEMWSRVGHELARLHRNVAAFFNPGADLDVLDAQTLIKTWLAVEGTAIDLLRGFESEMCPSAVLRFAPWMSMAPPCSTSVFDELWRSELDTAEMVQKMVLAIEAVSHLFRCLNQHSLGDPYILKDLRAKIRLAQELHEIFPQSLLLPTITRGRADSGQLKV